MTAAEWRDDRHNADVATSRTPDRKQTWSEWVNGFIRWSSMLLVAVFAFGCSDPITADNDTRMWWALATNNYNHDSLPPTCYEQGGVTYRARENAACLSPVSTAEALAHVLEIAGASPTILAGWDVVFSEGPPFEGANGATLTHERVVLANDADVAYVKHEFLHAVLWETTGDADGEHAGAGWEKL